MIIHGRASSGEGRETEKVAATPAGHALSGMRQRSSGLPLDSAPGFNGRLLTEANGVVTMSQQPDSSPAGPENENAGRSPGRPKQKEVAVKENRLLAVALQEFLQHGYGGASMSRIVRAAGASKTTLYSRFSSKPELFRAIIQRQIERLSPETLLGTETGPSDLETGLRTYANRMLEQNLRGELLGVNRLIYSESHRFPELGAAAAERTALGIRRISHFINACATADRIPCRDPRAAAEAFIFMIRGWYIDVMVADRKVSRAQREQWVQRMVHVLVSARHEW